jgi:hypothetical protein
VNCSVFYFNLLGLVMFMQQNLIHKSASSKIVITESEWQGMKHEYMMQLIYIRTYFYFCFVRRLPCQSSHGMDCWHWIMCPKSKKRYWIWCSTLMPFFFQKLKQLSVWCTFLNAHACDWFILVCSLYRFRWVVVELLGAIKNILTGLTLNLPYL